MFHDSFRSTLLLTLLTICCVQVRAASSYINDFVDPKFIAAKQFDIRTNWAGITILRWATEFSKKGPWSVTNSTVIPPSGDRHDYMSWMSNAWPNCTAVNNATLTEDNRWKLCPYVHRNEVNPDTVKVNAASKYAFNQLADAVLYNSIASVIARVNNDMHARNAVSHLQTWFLDPERRMNPNLNYAQMKRGPKGQLGHYGGIMELRAFVKIASGISILRESRNSIYTPAIDQGMIEWCDQYLRWLGTSVQGVRESSSLNYHSTFYSAQLAALKLIVNDRQGAINTIDTFFHGKFMAQIDSTGEQPLEQNIPQAQRHRTSNLAALVSLVRMAKYANPSSGSYWNVTTSQGGTIQSALDFAMIQAANLNNITDRSGDIRHLEPLVAAVASTFGDPDKKYETFLSQADPTYARKPYFFWNQPLSGGPSEDHDRMNGTGRPRALNGSSRLIGIGQGALVLVGLSSVLLVAMELVLST